MMRGAYLLAAAVVAAAIAPRVAHAQDDPAALISLIEKQPADLDRATWKEKRRDAARKLVASRDRRAVPVLIRLAEGESFDIIGEIAIEGLGALGDPSAIPALERIAADNSRDRGQRELARKSLAKLRAAPTAPPPPPPPPPAPTEPAPAPVTPVEPAPTPIEGAADAGLGPTPPAPIAGAPVWDDDVLAARESLTFALGGIELGYDTVRQRTEFDLDVDSHYARRVERERSAWGVTADLDTLAGVLNPDGPAASRLIAVTAAVAGEFRAYGGPDLYGVAQVALAPQLHYLSVEDDNDMSVIKDVRFIADLGAALGGGWGRVLDVGARMRVQQLAAVLERARALGRPIDDALARRLQATWWALRRDRTAYRQLTATVAILREAGVLLGEPDAGTTYELLEVLRDPSFDSRPSGVDVQLLVGETYLVRDNQDDDGVPDVYEGRFEQVMLRARVARQLGLSSDAEGWLDARYRLLAPDGEPTPWRAAAGGRFRTFAHGDHGELLGALDIGGELAASSDGDDDGVEQDDDADPGASIRGTVGWTWTLNRASSVRAGGEVRVAVRELFIGLSLTASYGFLDAGFARSAP